MFNTTNNTAKTDIKTPATGIIQRSADNSFFLNLHQKSNLADDLFDDKPKYKEKPVSVIQVMLINDGYMLAECVYLTPTN